jgi:hypothetical protein
MFNVLMRIKFEMCIEIDSVTLGVGIFYKVISSDPAVPLIMSYGCTMILAGPVQLSSKIA